MKSLQDLNDTERLEVQTRLEAKTATDLPAGCRLWTAATDADGYGLISVKGRMYRAHRIAYWLVHGAIPAGAEVMHRCDTPGCVNPAHLELGTHAANMADRDYKGRQRNGRVSSHRRLTDAEAEEIRVLRNAGLSQVGIARRFGISNVSVCNIVNGVSHARAA